MFPMRNQIIETLFQKMSVDPDIFFVTADMGINLVERFQDKYPDRYLNVGIAEQSLITVCAGLCNTGYRPFAYTISNFLVHRCYEQIRNDIAIHNYPVTLLGTGAGYDNPPLGPTHHVIDDLGAIRNIPGIDIYCPSSVTYAQGLLDKIISRSNPAYVRIPKGEFKEPDSADDLFILKGTETNRLLVSYGTCAQTCFAAQKLRPEVSVLCLNCLRPLDEDRLSSFFELFSDVITVEDHFPRTGLYGELSLLWVSRRLKPRLLPLGPVDYNLTVGATAESYHMNDSTDIASVVRAIDSL